jgi:hypothetical protein
MFTDTLIASLPHLAASLLAAVLAKTAKYCWFNRYAFLQWIFRKVPGLASSSKIFSLDLYGALRRSLFSLGLLPASLLA